MSHYIQKDCKIYVTDPNIALPGTMSHVPVELWEPTCKSSSLPVDRKYQKGQSRDNYIIII